MANSQEFKYFTKQMSDVVCVQETWLRPTLDYVLYGYTVVRRDRNQGGGGGCASFIKQGLPHRVLDKGEELEFLVVGSTGEGGGSGNY